MPFAGELSALLTAFLWSGTSIVFTEAARRVGSVQVNISRMVLALPLLLVTILLAGWSMALSDTQWLYFSLSGIIGLILGDSFLFKAFKDIGPRLSMLIMSLVPAMTAILAYLFLDEVLSGRVLAGMIITTTGIMLVVLERKPLPGFGKPSGVGLLAAFLGALGQAGGLILAKYAFAEGDVNSFVASFVRIGSATVLFLPAALILRIYKNPFRVFKDDRKALVLTSSGAVLGPYLGITFSLFAIVYTKVAIATTIIALPPIIMLPMVWWYYREPIGWKSVLGALLAVGGVAVLFLR